MIGRERAIDERKSEKEAFKFIVSPNREVWVMLPVKTQLISRYFEVLLLNLLVNFVVKAEKIRIENKHMTAMFAAFQNFKV